MNIKKQTVMQNDLVLSTRDKCKILGLNRSTYYYKEQSKKIDLNILNKMDEIFTIFPFYGHRKIHKELLDLDYSIGRDRVLKYMEILGLNPIYPQKKTTIRNKEHKVYPYLLKDLEITRPNQVWATDITYIKMKGGFCYLVAIIDWYSRCILSYRLSNSLDKEFCISALEEALSKYGTPEIFNSDQGCQFTSNEFTKILLEKEIKISMDSKGRALDNIIIERFFRSLKYEDVYIYEYNSIPELKLGLKRYMYLYNFLRKHETLDYKTPYEIYSNNNKILNINLVKSFKENKEEFSVFLNDSNLSKGYNFYKIFV